MEVATVLETVGFVYLLLSLYEYKACNFVAQLLKSFL